MSQTKKKSGTQTIFWWIAWITASIVSFFVASAIWSPIIYKYFGSVRETKASVMWVIAVFGTWMIFLVPLIVFMYQKVDKAYEDARLRREKNEKRFRSVHVPDEQRKLSPEMTGKLSATPESIKGGHLINLILKNGRKVSDVFVANRAEIMGIYNVTEMDFQAKDIKDFEPVDLNHAPHYLEMNWLRLDGVTSSE